MMKMVEISVWCYSTWIGEWLVDGIKYRMLNSLFFFLIWIFIYFSCIFLFLSYVQIWVNECGIEVAECEGMMLGVLSSCKTHSEGLYEIFIYYILTEWHLGDILCVWIFYGMYLYAYNLSYVSCILWSPKESYI